MSPLSLPSKSDGPISWSTANDEPYYTDEDLLILHDIVVRAQQILPTLPPRDRLCSNALFRAYYKLLPIIGIDSDHDDRYLRLLFKINDLRDFDGTLYEKFEEVLRQKNITIEFDADSHEYIRSSKATSQDVADNKESDTLYNDENEPPLPRRNSESGVLDLQVAAEAQQPEEPKHKRNKSVSPLPLGPVTPAKINELKSFISEATRAPSPELIPEPTPQPPRTTQKGRAERGVKNVMHWLARKDDSPRSRRSASASTQGSIRGVNRHPERDVQRGRPSDEIPLHTITNDQQDTSDELTTTSEAEEQYDSEEITVPKVSVEHNEKRAKIIEDHYFGDHIQRNIATWREKARKNLARKKSLEALAMKHDIGALEFQAFGIWLDKAQESKKARLQLQKAQEAAEKAQEAARKVQEAAERAHQAELKEQERLLKKEKQFARYEKRAGKLVDGRLMLKCLTHWQVRAREEMEITKAAERQMNRSQCYTTWKTHTEETEEKEIEEWELAEELYRQNLVKRCLGRLSAKAEELVAEKKVAATIGKAQLLARVFARMEEKKKLVDFTAQVEEKTKQEAFSTWDEKTQVIAEKTQLADDEALLNVVTKATKTWKAKTNEHVALNEEAEGATKAKQLGGPLQKWRREAKTAPAKKAVEASHVTNVAKGSLSRWKLHAQQEKQAAKIDHDNILNEALAKWRHKTNLRRFQDYSNHCHVDSAFQTWRLKTRLTILQKDKQEEVRSACLEVWFDRFQDTRSRRWERDEMARRHDNQSVATDALKDWYARMDGRADLEAQAEEFQAPGILSRSLGTLHQKIKQTKRKNYKAHRFNDFFVMRGALRKWQVAAKKAKRERRIAAYLKVRRRGKINLANDVLSIWRARAQEKRAPQEEAGQFTHNKTVITGMNSFDQWRARSEEVAELEPVWKDTVKGKYTGKWKDRAWALQTLKLEATLDNQEHSENRAVKKWSMKALQAKAMANTAQEVYDRSTRKAAKKIFNYWRMRTSQQRPIVDITPAGTETAENWSDFGEEVDMDELTKRLHDRSMSHQRRDVATPGYLTSRPRRRIFAASEQFHSTTPRERLTTPRERELRRRLF